MLDSIVWILAGITAWCVASLALALIVGPLVRRTERARGGAAPRPVAATRLIAPVQIPR
jgi:predicted PurR-regulated permease PerM